MSPLDRIANVSILKVPAPFPRWTQAFLLSLSHFSFDEQYKLLRSDDPYEVNSR